MIDAKIAPSSMITAPAPSTHFSFALEVLKDLFYFAQIDPYVTSVRLSFSPRYFFVGYYSEKREKNYLEKWDPLHVTTRKMTSIPLDLKQREPSFRPDGKGSVKSSRWDEWAQRAKIAPKMLEDAVPFLANKSNHFGSFRPQIWCRYITRMYSMG